MRDHLDQFLLLNPIFQRLTKVKPQLSWPIPAQKLIGDFAPELVDLTDRVFLGDVWERPELSKRDRSLATVSALIAS
jgi:hypothetical protein